MSRAASLIRFARSAPVNPGVWPASDVEVDHLGERLAASVDLEDPLATLAIGPVDHDLAVEAAGPEQRRVEDVGPVGGGDEDDVVLHLEAVHLDEELVQGLLALVVAAAHAGAAVAADGVDLVHEDDAWGVLLGLLEEVADAAGADPDEHLDEVGAGDREERHTGLTGDRPREQGLAGSWRPVEQHALRDASAQRLEALGVLEELLDLVQLLHGLVDPGDVAEGDLGSVDRHALRPRLAEAHHARAAALHLVHQEDPEPEEQEEREDVGEDREEARAAGALDLGRHSLLAQQVDQLGLRVAGGRIAHRVALAVGLLDSDRARLLVERDGLDRRRVLLDLRDERVVGRGRLRARAADQPLREERQHDHDQDRERRAPEEPPHLRSPARNTAPPAWRRCREARGSRA